MYFENLEVILYVSVFSNHLLPLPPFDGKTLKT